MSTAVMPAFSSLPRSKIARQKPPKKKTKRPMGALKRKLDVEFAAMIRLRDEGKVCVTCEVNPGTQCGHFMVRARQATRWHPLNCASQCSGCNCWGHGKQLEFADYLDWTYGPGTSRRLRELSVRSWKPSREALEKLLEAAKLGADSYVEIWNFYGSEPVIPEGQKEGV